MSSKEIAFEAILFDLDGTLVDSRACLAYAWQHWAEFRGIQKQAIANRPHGRAVAEVISQLAPHLDPLEESQIFADFQLTDLSDLKATPGAVELLNNPKLEIPWAIVTASPVQVVRALLQELNIPLPKVLVTYENVKKNKPDPEGYLLAAELLGVSPSSCLVVEDTPIGVKAARAANMNVLALGTTYPADHFEPGTMFIPDLSFIPLDSLAQRRLTLDPTPSPPSL